MKVWKFLVGAPSGTRTRTGAILSRLPLPLGYQGAPNIKDEGPKIGRPPSPCPLWIAANLKMCRP